MSKSAPQIEVELRMQRSMFDGYRPHLQVDDGEYLGVSFFDVSLEGDAGHLQRAKAYLMYWPNVDYTALKTGVQFQIKEGATTVGVGRIVVGVEHHAV